MDRFDSTVIVIGIYLIAGFLFVIGMQLGKIIRLLEQLVS